MTALEFYQKLAGQKQVTTRAAAQLSGVSIPAASMALRRLASSGLSTQLKKGSWLLGTSNPKDGALVIAAAAPYAAYLSGWSALRLHGRIQQIPQTQFAVTLGRPREVGIPGARVALHGIKPELFGGFVYDPRVEGFVASSEKALFDLAYFTAMNRSRISGSLPETDIEGIRWKEVLFWLKRIQTPRVRAAVERALRSVRKQQAPP